MEVIQSRNDKTRNTGTLHKNQNTEMLQESINAKTSPITIPNAKNRGTTDT